MEPIRLIQKLVNGQIVFSVPDALILATCKLHSITQLASYNSDFATACAREGIRLVQTVADLTA